MSTREAGVGWGNVALVCVVIACLSVAGLAVYEVSCSSRIEASP